MTSYGFFRDEPRFQQKFMYYHFMPTAGELGFNCPEGLEPGHAMAVFYVGSTVQAFTSQPRPYFACASRESLAAVFFAESHIESSILEVRSSPIITP